MSKKSKFKIGDTVVLVSARNMFSLPGTTLSKRDKEPVKIKFITNGKFLSITLENGYSVNEYNIKKYVRKKNS